MNTLHIDEQTGWRGGEQQASYLMRGLAARGHRVVIAGRHGSPFLTSDHGAHDAPRLALPFRGEVDPVTVLGLAGAIKAHAIDIIHAHTSHAHTYACLARMIARRGHVVVSRRVDFVPKRHLVNRWKYRAPNRIVAISECIGRVLLDWGVEPERLRVVRSGVDPARFDVPPLSREELGIPPGVPLLGNLAALVGHKDHATLLNAMPAVLRELPDLRLVILGEGKLRPELEAQIARLSIGHRVMLLGYRKDAPRVLRALDVFVMSSKEEGLGTATVEALMCRKPLVATAGGGIPEIIRDGDTGLLVPVGDSAALAAAIVRVFRDSALAEAIAARGYDFATKECTADAMVEGNLRVYEELL